MNMFKTWYMHGMRSAAFFAAIGSSAAVFSQPAITVRGVILAQDGTAQGAARVIFTTSGAPQNMIEYPTAASGAFTVSLMMAVKYNVRVMAPGYPLQYFDKVSPDTTDDGPPPMAIVFSDGDSMTVRLSMTPKSVSPAYGMLRGKIYDSTGAPLAFARVTAMAVGRDVTGEVETDAAGQYVCRVPAQNHYLCCTWYPYPTQFWTPNGSTLSPGSQGLVSVAPNDTVHADIKMVMNPQGAAPVDTTAKRGRIFGHVWDQLRALPVTGAAVFALRQDSAAGVPSFNPQTAVSPYGANTDSSGYYSIGNVPPGSYYVFARAAGYTAQVYPYMDQPQQATPVRIDSAGMGAIDFGLRTTGPVTTLKGGVSGKVVTKNGNQPIAAMVVGALRLDSVNSSWINSGNFNPSFIYTPYTDTSSSDGSYSVKNLPAGAYILFVKGQNYLPQFYFNADSVQAAKRIVVDSTVLTGLDFMLRAGGAIYGRVVTAQGKGLYGASVNANMKTGGFSSYAPTDSNGYFAVTGLSAGQYCLYVSGGNFLSINDSNQCSYMVADGATLSGITIVVNQGGIIMGPYNAPAGQDSLYNSGFEIALFTDTLASKDSILWESRTVWANLFYSAQTHSTGWTFVSNAVPEGKWRLLLRASPLRATASGAAQRFVQTRGYCFGNGAGFAAQTPVTVTGGDTVRLVGVNFPTGYSVFGRMSLENGEKNMWCTVTAYSKEGGVFIPVCRTSASSDSAFELPGLIDGHDYFIRIDAPNYPSQFWSPTGSSVRPVSPYHFSTSSFVAANVRAVQYPEGMSVTPSQLWAGFNATDTGGVQIQCSTSRSLPLDSIFLYGKDSTGAAVALTSFAYSSTRFSYVWKETRKVQPGSSLTYVFVGKGPVLTLRSNIVYYYAPDTGKIPADSLRITLTPTRTGVQISWRADSSFAIANNDTTVLYRKAPVDTGWIAYKIMAGSQNMFWDGAWDKTRDVGKTVYYRVRMTAGGAVIKQSPVVSFTATQSFINQMANVLPVGPTMKYATIQQAVDAAQDFDIVAVEPGVYPENINTRGKAVSLQANWTNGKAPVIDGIGGAAITVAYTSKSMDKDCITINGFKIQNSLVGVVSSANVSVNQCLFVRIVKDAVQGAADSAAVAAAGLIDPFAQFQMNLNVWQCTFIGKGTGGVAVRAYSKTGASSADTISNMQTPTTPSAYASVGNSIFAFYASPYAPADGKGSGFTVELKSCDFWQTSKTPISKQVTVGADAVSIDPMFIDTVDYFKSDGSQLNAMTSRGGGWGYDVRRGYNGKDKNEPDIPAVTNFKAMVVGTRSIALSWNPLPDSVQIDGYVVFRALGYDSLFIVNANSQWQPKVADSLIFSILDTFRTRATSFVDTTPVAGRPYLYAVAGISAGGNIGKVNLPFPPPLSAYIIKIDPLSSVPSLAATLVGFNSVALQWKKPSFVKNAAPEYSFYRVAGGRELQAAAGDSAAIRALVRQCASGAVPSISFSTRDTVFFDSTASMGSWYVYVVSVADSSASFERRPLTWTVVAIDTTRFVSQRTIKLIGGQWAMIGPWGVGSVPFTDTSSALFSWDDAKTADKLYSQYVSAGSLRGCQGYWVSAGKDTMIAVSDSMYAGAVRQRDSISITLVKGQTGWNQIASPFPFAVAPPWLGDGAFTAYAWAADSSQYVERSQLLPWQACWVHIDRDTQLVFRSSQAVRPNGSAHVGKHVSGAAWELKVSLAGKSNDPDNYIGVVSPSRAKARLSRLKPPQAFDYPQLYLLDAEAYGGRGPEGMDKLSKLYKQSAAAPREKVEWMAGISAASTAMKVQFQGVSSIPDNVHVFWITASSVVNLREKADVDVPAHKRTAYGYIVATTNPGDVALYGNRVELRRSFPNPFRTNATIEFLVPYAWRADGSKQEGEKRDVSLMLFNLSGRRVATLLSGPAAVGRHRVVWNGMTDAGGPVAPGIVIARLSGSNFQKTMKMFKIR